MFIIGDHFDSDIYRAFGFHICHITYLLISFYLYLICIFAYESNAFRFNVSRIAEWEENALLVGRKLLDDNISHLYSYDTSVTTDHDDYLSNALEVSVVNLFDRATHLGRQRLERISSWHRLSTSGQEYSTSKYQSYTLSVIQDH